MLKGKAGLYDHFVQINAKEYVPVTKDQEPINNIMPLAKSPFDMRLSKHLGRAIFKLPKEGKGSKGLIQRCYSIPYIDVLQFQNILNHFNVQLRQALQVDSMNHM